MTNRTFGLGRQNSTYKHKDDDNTFKNLFVNQIEIISEKEFAKHGDSGSLVVSIQFFTDSIQIHPLGILHRYSEGIGYAFDLNSFIDDLSDDEVIMFDKKRKYAFFYPEDYIKLKK